jgi:predicted metal-dependent peptidase
MVLRAMGAPTLLHPGAVPWRHRVPTGDKVRVYIDVSGSMDSVLRALYGAVLDCKDRVYRTVHLFSTKVADLSLADLKAGKCESTGGTDIGCVAEHMARNRVTRALLITDGWVGTPRGQHYKTLARSRLAVAYLGNQFNQTDLQSVANHTSILKTGA